MRVYRPTYRDRTGKRRELARWYCDYRTDGVARPVAGFSDRRSTEALARRIEHLASVKGSGDPPDRATLRWAEGLPRATRERLIALGLLPALRAPSSLEDLLTAFERSILDGARTPHHARQHVARVRRVLAGAGCARLTDLDPLRVERYLASERERPDGIGRATSNHLLAALRAFLRWAMRHDHFDRDPLRHLRPLNAAVDIRRERRALTPEELARLIEATRTGPRRGRMDGPHRALLYLLAAETGLRRNELRSLRAEAFEGLGTDRPAVRLQASASKRRREDWLPLRHETARATGALLGALRGKRPFPVPVRAAEMLRADLLAAGIPEADELGRVVDFHALRVTFGSALARSGVPVKVAQTLMRHSTPTLTFAVYAKLGANDLRPALDLLPRVMLPDMLDHPQESPP